MPKLSLTLICLALFALIRCDQLKSSSEQSSNDEDPNIVKRYHENGKIKSIYEINELRQKHGSAKIYDEKGQITKSFKYDNDQKTQAVQYYPNGQPLLEINYKNGAKDGPMRRFYDNGQMESEIIYRDDYPGTGLKEYSKSGKLRTHYPELIVKAHDEIEQNGRYTIEVYFGDQPGRGTYYVGPLTDDQFMNYSMDELKKSNYKGQLVLKPAYGMMIMEKLTFVGEFKTPTGNKYIVSKDFNLVIDPDF